MDGTLGERELDVMSTLWREGPGTVADVRDRLPVPLAYNTVLTILRNLETKSFVGHTAEGRLFRYHPVVDEATVRGNALTRLVGRLFSGSPAHLMAHLVNSEHLSAAELRHLHRVIDERLRPTRSRLQRGGTAGDANPKEPAERVAPRPSRRRRPE